MRKTISVNDPFRYKVRVMPEGERRRLGVINNRQTHEIKRKRSGSAETLYRSESTPESWMHSRPVKARKWKLNESKTPVGLMFWMHV